MRWGGNSAQNGTTKSIWLTGGLTFIFISTVLWSVAALIVKPLLDWLINLGIMDRGNMHHVACFWIRLARARRDGAWFHLVYGLWKLDRSLLMWWVLPIVVGFLLGWTKRRIDAKTCKSQKFETSWNDYLKKISVYGEVVTNLPSPATQSGGDYIYSCWLDNLDLLR